MSTPSVHDAHHVHCRIKNCRIKEPYRNMGYSFGLEYPIIYGELDQCGWIAWDRHTGYVKFVAGSSNQYVATRQCINFAMPMNYASFNADLDSVS